MRFLTHLFIGVIILIVFYFLIHPDVTVFALSSAALLLGSVLPDIDHPLSKIRKAFRTLMFVALFIFLLIFLLFPPISNFIQQQCVGLGCGGIVFIVQVVLAAVISFVIVMIIDFIIPFHRGPLHGLAAAVGYAVICGFVSMNFSPSYLMIAAAGLVGYLSHIIPDALTKE